MKFEEQLEHLDALLRERSTDFDEMRRTLTEIRKSGEMLCFLDKAQDRLYASIASGHLKVLRHLETGDVERAKQEAAAAIAWFHHRFEYFQPDPTGRFPKIADVLKSISEVATKSATLRETLKRQDISVAFSPSGENNEKPVR